MMLFALLACTSGPPAPVVVQAPVAPPPEAPAPLAPPVAAVPEEAPTEPATVIPETYAGTVAAMKERRAALQGLLDAGNLKDVHPVAAGLIDLATALPAQAASFAPAEKGRVALTCIDLKAQADALHDAADAGDAAAARAAFTTVTADVDTVAAFVK